VHNSAANTRELVDRVSKRLGSPVCLESDSTSGWDANTGNRAFEHANSACEPDPLAPLIMHIHYDRYQIEHIDQFLRRGRFIFVENSVTT
jgi:hypothetical protein